MEVSTSSAVVVRLRGEFRGASVCSFNKTKNPEAQASQVGKLKGGGVAGSLASKSSPLLKNLPSAPLKRAFLQCEVVKWLALSTL